jgi:hypothetical protein
VLSDDEAERRKVSKRCCCCCTRGSGDVRVMFEISVFSVQGMS